METKVCSKCSIEKDISEFNKCKDGKYGVRGDCILCHKETARMYRVINKKELYDKAKIRRKDRTEDKRLKENAYHKELYYKNLEHSRERSRRNKRNYVKRHPERVKESKKRSDKRYYETHKQIFKEKGRIYNQINAIKNRERVKKWKELNKEWVKGRYKREKLNNPEKVRNKYLESQRRIKARLTNYYIAQRLKLRVKEILQYPELIETKRLQIKILNKLKEVS